MNRDAVLVQFASRLDGWLAAGAGGHRRVDREGVEETAIELLETRDESGTGAGRSRGAGT